MRSRRHFQQAMWGTRYGMLRRGGVCILYDDTGEIICELTDHATANAILRHLRANEHALPVRHLHELLALAAVLLRSKLAAFFRGEPMRTLWLEPRRRRCFRGIRCPCGRR